MFYMYGKIILNYEIINLDYWLVFFFVFFDDFVDEVFVEGNVFYLNDLYES